MVFSSSIFLFFFLPLVIIGHYLLREKYRVYFLLFASLFFYAWGEPRYVLVMLLSIAINYTFGILIDKAFANKSLAKTLLVLSIALNLGILFYFKYLDFSLSAINGIFYTGYEYKDIIMPIGISFFTFQGMSYVIDLYWRKVDVQKNPAKLAFFISFFPQLIAGPIVRYIDIRDQIDRRAVSADNFAAGARRFVIGLAKKVIIANNVGEVVDLIFALPVSETAHATAWLGVICYSFQIYFDFSGYSDMAIGLGKIFGFRFLENFNYPYISKTVTEFWRRWHISLSSWFRDYVYIPLGGNRKGNVYVNLILVFALTGFWHGADFQFLVWGLWHGLFLLIERLFRMREVQDKKFVPLRYALTMMVVLIGWVFFRSPGLPHALNYLGLMFGLVQPESVGFTVSYYLGPKLIFMLCLAAFASTPALKLFYNFLKNWGGVVAKQTISVLVLVLLFVCMVFVTASSYNPFIYFRF